MTRIRHLGVSILVLAASACAQGSPPPTAGETPRPTTSAASTASSSPIASTSPSAAPTTGLAGKWALDRTCAAMVRALTDANRPELIATVVTELVETGFDPADPCAKALPPIKHSHTFWPDGRFNSYDENEQEVDFGRWELVDDDTARIGDPPKAEFDFVVTGDQLSLVPIIADDCTTPECPFVLGWQFAVAFPGETWTRETTGAHVP